MITSFKWNTSTVERNEHVLYMLKRSTFMWSKYTGYATRDFMMAKTKSFTIHCYVSDYLTVCKSEISYTVNTSEKFW